MYGILIFHEDFVLVYEAYKPLVLVNIMMISLYFKIVPLKHLRLHGRQRASKTSLSLGAISS